MKKGLLALSPLAVFIILYLVTSIIAHDFYKVPIAVAFMAASIYAVTMTGGIPIRKRIDIYSKGAGTEQMMMMIWIFVLAGAFANTAKSMGAIDATVNLTLNLLPGNMLLAGIFLAACFISISIGTSVGTIVALTPIAAGITTQTDISLPMMTAVVVGGSFFGDNLSFISDTTIVSTSTQHCKLSDKFRVNSFLVMPTAFLILIVWVAQLVIQQLVGNGLSLLHGHLCQTYLLLAVLIDEVEQRNDNQHWSQHEDDEQHTQHEEHTCEVFAPHLAEGILYRVSKIVIVHIVVPGM